MVSDSVSDPFSQSFTLLLSDGTPFNVSIADLDSFITYSIDVSINYAAQLGASLVLLLVLVLLTKPDKRSSPLFIINCLTLALNFIRLVLDCLYYTGPWSEVYAYFAQDYSRVPLSSYAQSVAITVLTLLTLICIEGSLMLQIHVVCLTLRRLYRQIIFGLSFIVALLAVGFRFALCVENSMSIMSLSYLIPIDWIVRTSNITTTLSVYWFCLVFVTKLGFALHQRRKLGLRRFGPMQVLFIMGCQTLLVPVIFSILEYTTELPAMDSNVLTAVAIFLPLSALWASASLESPVKALPMLKRKPKHVKSSTDSGSNDTYLDKKRLNDPSSPSVGESTRFSSSTVHSPTKTRLEGVLVDLERQGF